MGGQQGKDRQDDGRGVDHGSCRRSQARPGAEVLSRSGASQPGLTETSLLLLLTENRDSSSHRAEGGRRKGSLRRQFTADCQHSGANTAAAAPHASCSSLIWPTRSTKHQAPSYHSRQQTLERTEKQQSGGSTVVRGGVIKLWVFGFFKLNPTHSLGNIFFGFSSFVKFGLPRQFVCCCFRMVY